VRKLSLIFLIVAIGLVACEDNCGEHSSIHVLRIQGDHPGDSAHIFVLSYYDSTMYPNGQESISASGFRSSIEYDAHAIFWNWYHAPTGGDAVNPDIECDAENHQVFYRISEGLDMTITYDDTDGNGNPLGIRTILTTGQPSSGQLTITLIHGPNKFADEVSAGDITNAGGLVDFECTFDVEIH
jgi:hypothetical protein